MASTTAKDLPTAAEILNKFYTAETAYMSAPPEKRDFRGGMGAVLSPDFVVTQSPDLPWGGEWKGLDGFQRWSEVMAGYFDVLEVQNPKIYVQEDAGGDGSTVLVESVLRLRTREGGKEWVKPMLQVVRVDRERGVLKSITPFYWDVRGLREVLGA